MRTKKVVYFSMDDWDFVSRLAKTGIGLNQAKMLVFLDRTGEVSTHDIERGADMRQPEVNNTGKKCLKRGWVVISEKKNEGRAGRSPQYYRLAKSFQEIIADIEREKREEAQKEIGLINKIRNCL
jgi:predicted transcriptional regulator